MNIKKMMGMALGLLLIHQIGSADLLILKDGSTLRGTIERVTDSVVSINTDDGIRVIPRKVVLGAYKEPRAKEKSIITDQYESPQLPKLTPLYPSANHIEDPEIGLSKVRSGGPRFGIVHLSGKSLEHLKSKIGGGSVLTAWGWQFESAFAGDPDGAQGLIEFVPMVLGLERSIFLPTLNVLFGLRFAQGFEFGVGPNFAPNSSDTIGVGMALAAGYNFNVGRMNIPLNIALVSSRNDLRYAISVGWNFKNF